MATAAPVRFGQIVFAEVADANGIRKVRPAIVVTPSDCLQESGPFEVVAITSQVPQPLPDDIHGMAVVVPGQCLLEILSKIPRP
jgi:hypothetical protein